MTMLAALDRAVRYALAHQFTTLAVVAALIALGHLAARLLGPRATAFLRAHPRLGHALDVVREAFPDVVPAVRSLARIVLGAPWAPPAAKLLAADVTTLVVEVDGAQAHAQLDALTAKAEKLVGLVAATAVVETRAAAPADIKESR